MKGLVAEMRRIALVMLFVSFCSGAFALTEEDLNLVAARMSSAAGRSFDIEVEEDPVLNAYAYPDGHLVVTTGMLEACTTPDQLAFILGHEMVHVLRKHSLRQAEKGIGWILGAALLSQALGLNDDLKGVVNFGVGAQLAHYSREDEYEADSQGLPLAVKAGYRPQGGLEAMQLLLSRYGRGDAQMPVLGLQASHPDTQNRVNKLRELASKLNAGQPAPEVRTETASSVAPPTPAAPAEVAIEDPNLSYRFGDIASHVQKGTDTLSVSGAPEGTVKVTVRLLGANGKVVTQGETEKFSPAMITINPETLRQHGKRFQLEIVALDGDGIEIDRATITIVVQ